MTHRIALALGLLLVGTTLTACGVSADFGIASGALGLLLVAVPFINIARAGAPMPCEGYEATSCENGRLYKHCCPKGAKCNFDFPQYTECANQTCVVGKDIGRCPANEPVIDSTKKSKDECGDGWQDACVSRKVTKACILPVPTNYTGPMRNPPYRTCGPDRCTTLPLIEDCYLTRAEVGSKACLGTWTQVCLGGKVIEKCLPPLSPDTFRAKTFSTCGDGSCVVGPDKSTCPR